MLRRFKAYAFLCSVPRQLPSSLIQITYRLHSVAKLWSLCHIKTYEKSHFGKKFRHAWSIPKLRHAHLWLKLTVDRTIMLLSLTLIQHNIRSRKFYPTNTYTLCMRYIEPQWFIVEPPSPSTFVCSITCFSVRTHTAVEKAEHFVQKWRPLRPEKLQSSSTRKRIRCVRFLPTQHQQLRYKVTLNNSNEHQA